MGNTKILNPDDVWSFVVPNAIHADYSTYAGDCGTATVALKYNDLTTDLTTGTIALSGETITVTAPAVDSADAYNWGIRSF